tara:strand:- start:137 stop:310 length:174 start_codon:yes stop_codon:yes gene_type:complete
MITLSEALDFEGCRFWPEQQREILEEIADREGIATDEVKRILIKIACEFSDTEHNRR